MFLKREEAVNLAAMAEIIRIVRHQKNMPEIKNVSGGRGYTYLVNKTEIVKFPRDEETCGNLYKEARISSYLQGKLSAEVPLLTLHREKLRGQSAEIEFATMPCLKGVPLFLSLEQASLTEDEKYKIGAQLGNIIAQMHALPLKEVGALGLPNEKNYIQELLEDVNPTIEKDLKKMSSFTQNQLLESVSRFVFGGEGKPVLCHRDLHEKNILINPETKKISAILDFGEAIQASAGVDLSLGMIFLKKSLREGMLEGYEEATGQKRVAEKIQKSINPMYIEKCYQAARQNIKAYA